MKYSFGVLISLVFIVALVGSCYAGKKISEKSMRIKNLYEQISVGNADAEVQYIKEFPHTLEELKQVFGQEDFSELYDGRDYILILERLCMDHSVPIGELLFNLSAGAHYEPDGIGYLQHAAAKCFAKNTSVFVAISKLHPAKDVEAVALFLADVENPEANPDYSAIIQNLGKLNQTKLKDVFIRSKEMRKKNGAGTR